MNDSHYVVPIETHRTQEGSSAVMVEAAVSQSEVLGRFYNPNTTPKDKE